MHEGYNCPRKRRLHLIHFLQLFCKVYIYIIYYIFQYVYTQHCWINVSTTIVLGANKSESCMSFQCHPFWNVVLLSQWTQWGWPGPMNVWRKQASLLTCILCIICINMKYSKNVKHMHICKANMICKKICRMYRICEICNMIWIILTI